MYAKAPATEVLRSTVLQTLLASGYGRLQPVSDISSIIPAAPACMSARRMKERKGTAQAGSSSGPPRHSRLLSWTLMANRQSGGASSPSAMPASRPFLRWCSSSAQRTSAVNRVPQTLSNRDMGTQDELCVSAGSDLRSQGFKDRQCKS